MRNPEHVHRTETVLPLPLEEVFAFFSEAGNLERITPPELSFRIVSPTPVALRQGARIDYRLSLFGVPFLWRTEITAWNPPHAFEDTQLSGPYAQWIHRHSFRAVEGGTEMRDEVRWRLPVPLLGQVAYPLVRLQVGRIFRYRERKIRELLVGPLSS
jgi:ligand-binding SRPBCC domain-containing protein